MPRPLTVGVDGSPESLAAAQWAAGEAVLRDLPLRLVNVWQWPPQIPVGAVGGGPSGIWVQETLLSTRADLEKRHRGLRVTTEQVSGVPVRVLSEAADESEVMVLGSTGMGAVSGFLLGSVSAGVLARAHRPVVLVRATARAAEEDGVPGGGAPVVVGLDVSHRCDPLIGFAVDEALRREVPLRAVHVWQPPPMLAYDPTTVDPRAVAQMEERVREDLHEVVRPWAEGHPELRLDESVVRGDRARGLLGAAADAGLVVVGRRIHRVPLGVRVGPVAHAVLHHSECPVSVVAHD
ncbi:universal stress protein [Streptomyces sp. NPDC059637]|uniref:universal stress protein n=1 Tax=Streptomyces sp. NPDC059637 TaxID=3347752 RepID=UPI00369E89CD